MEELQIEILHLTYKEIQEAKQIYKYTKEMLMYIDQEDVDALTKTIALRQRWMEHADSSNISIQEKLKELQKKCSLTIEDADSKELLQNIQMNRTKRKEIYRSTYEFEQRNQERMKKLLEKYRVRIMGVQQGKEAFLKYGRSNKTGQSMMINSLK